MKQIFFAAITVIAFSASAAEGDKHKHMDHSPMAAMLAEKSGAEFEAAFLGMMIHHHMRGETMWALARERSKNETILALEKKTTPKEKAEVAQMKEWLKDWHKKTPEDFKEPEESRQMMEKDMAELKAADAKDFDALFAKKMAMHHMGAIEMCKLVGAKAENPELKKFAGEMSAAQSSDREKLLGVAKKEN